MVTFVVLFSRILLFMILPLDSTMESKHKCESHNEAKKVMMTLDKKIKILGKLHGSMNTATVALTFH
jgi:hypothetical protein